MSGIAWGWVLRRSGTERRSVAAVGGGGGGRVPCRHGGAMRGGGCEGRGGRRGFEGDNGRIQAATARFQHDSCGGALF